MYGLERPKRQKLSNVCNGGHIHTLDHLDAEGLKKAMGKETKAILIVGNDQRSARALLANKEILKGCGLKAKRLCAWSNSADLWMVRTI